ncbi:MAG: arsenical pump-driving ATPase [Phycisphaeraceae bacterium]
MAAKSWLDNPARYLFFTGKGGVGKTSLACATAVKLADAGSRVLLVSTDPASNLSHVFDTEVGEKPRAIAQVPNLCALNIDPEAAAASYRDRVVGPVRESLPEQVVRDMEEQLSGACTTEIAAFDEFTALLIDGEATRGYDHIIFDTAPTGHTLRLMKLPSAWTSFLDNSQNGASCLGPLAGLEKQKQQYAQAVRVLADGERTRMVLVSRPEVSALKEAGRTSAELADLGVGNQWLIVNGVMREPQSDDPLALAMAARGAEAMAAMPATLKALPLDEVLLQAHNLVGVEALRQLLSASPSAEPPLSDQPTAEIDVPSLRDLVDQIAEPGHGLVMVMGKGGVGKTTVAAAVAVELASRGLPVHLTTTDPAAHLTETIEAELEHLQVDRIDPHVETERYREHVLATKGRELDEQGRLLLEEDLRSPCTEEIAVFQAFSRIIREASKKFVVVDTAPTGHTLMLLDATGSYHREVLRQSSNTLKVTTPMMRLQDPEQTKMLLVTLPETTPVLEAAQLQEDLRRADIEPWAWVINASLAAAGPTDPLLLQRARAEIKQIEKVQREHATRTAIIPWMAEQPVGPQRLHQLANSHSLEL